MLHGSIEKLIFLVLYGLGGVFMLWVLWQLHWQLKQSFTEHGRCQDYMPVRTMRIASSALNPLVRDERFVRHAG
jgi:hypothetical protein